MNRENVISLLVLLMTVPAGALTLQPRPLSSYWPFATRPLNGQVQQIEIKTERPGQRPGQPGIVSYHALPEGGLQEKGRDYSITFDSTRRPIRVESRAHRPVAAGERPKQASLVETATYGPDGVPTQFEQQYDQEPATKLAVAAKKPADGVVALSWEYDFMDFRWLAELQLNAAGRVVRWQSNPPGFSGNPAWVFHYNQQGDVERIEMGAHSQDLYEYAYDDQNNWTRQTRYTVRTGKKEQQETVTRTITYGDPLAPIAQRPPAARPGAPKPASVGPAEMPDGPPPPAQPGARQYRMERGERGGFFNQMTLVLNPDRSAHLTIVTEFQGKTTNKTGLGTWSEDGDKVTAKIETAVDGSKLPEPLPMRFTRTKDDTLVAEHNAKMIFTPLTAEPAR